MEAGLIRVDQTGHKILSDLCQHLVRRCIQAVDAEKKVMIGFRLGDLWTDTFTYSKGKRAGEQGVSLKARLLFVSWIKVDGKLVYKAEPKPTDADDRDERDVRTARWQFPLYLLLIALPVLPLARLGQSLLGAQVPSDLYVLALPLAQGIKFDL